MAYTFIQHFRGIKEIKVFEVIVLEGDGTEKYPYTEVHYFITEDCEELVRKPDIGYPQVFKENKKEL